MIHQFTFIEKTLLRKGIIPQPLFDAGVSRGLAHVLNAAVETGITDTLSGKFQSAEQLVAKTNLNKQALILTLDCLEALGYVSRKKDHYAFTKNGEKFLSKDSPQNMRHYIQFSASESRVFAESLESVLQTGSEPKDSLADFTEEEWRLFTLAMLDIARVNVDSITKQIPAPASSKKLLDLGGSHGLYSIWQCKKHPELKAEILDAEAVRSYADQCISEYKMHDRVSFTAGDFMSMEWDEDYDMIFAFNIIHGMTEEMNRRLFQKAAQSLRKTGIFVIFDQIKDMEGKSQLASAVSSFMGMNLYLHTGGRTYNGKELTQMLRESDFASVKIKGVSVPGCGLAIAGV